MQKDSPWYMRPLQEKNDNEIFSLHMNTRVANVVADHNDLLTQ